MFTVKITQRRIVTFSRLQSDFRLTAENQYCALNMKNDASEWYNILYHHHTCRLIEVNPQTQYLFVILQYQICTRREVNTYTMYV